MHLEKKQSIIDDMCNTDETLEGMLTVQEKKLRAVARSTDFNKPIKDYLSSFKPATAL